MVHSTSKPLIMQQFKTLARSWSKGTPSAAILEVPTKKAFESLLCTRYSAMTHDTWFFLLRPIIVPPHGRSAHSAGQNTNSNCTKVGNKPKHTWTCFLTKFCILNTNSRIGSLQNNWYMHEQNTSCPGDQICLGPLDTWWMLRLQEPPGQAKHSFDCDDVVNISQ